LTSNVDRTLVILLSSHTDGDKIRFSELFPVLLLSAEILTSDARIYCHRSRPGRHRGSSR
jgi:hypothetical protein